jgi:hypothetical protein
MNRTGVRLLPLAATTFMVGNLLHGTDHLRRGWGLPLFGLTPEVMIGGVLITVGAAVTLVLALTNHRLGPRVAVAVGFIAAIFVSAAHLAPPWGVLSNSYLALRPDAFAWVVVVIEIGGAIFTGLAGLLALRHGTEIMKTAPP